MPTNGVPAQRAPDAAEVTVLDRPTDSVPPARVASRRAPEAGRGRPAAGGDREPPGFHQPAGCVAAGHSAVQAALSLRLVWSNTCSPTKRSTVGRAPRVGRTAAWHADPPVPHLLLRRAGVYRRSGRSADSLGGLAAARVLSCASCSVPRRCYGHREPAVRKAAGFFAAGLWAFLAPTLKLGGFATFDAMSPLLVASRPGARCAPPKCGTSPAGSSHRPQPGRGNAAAYSRPSSIPWWWPSPCWREGAVHQAAEDARCLTRRICDLGANSSCLRRARVLLDRCQPDRTSAD